MASITIRADGEEQKFALEAASVTLGRGLESDIRLKDIKSSRRHCQIVKNPNGFEVVDLSSGNGTLLNGAPVKQHKLVSGDKIQIGATVITFVDGDGGRAATGRVPAAGGKGAVPGAATAKVKKTGTGPVPTARASGDTPKPPGATTRTGVPKPTTGKLPTAPTKKITSSMPTVSKPPTQTVPRPSTTSIKKSATQRTGNTTRSTGYVSATQRFHTEARRNKVNPVAILIGVIVVIFLAVLGFIFFGGEDDSKLVIAQLNKVLTGAHGLYDAYKFNEAIVEYEKALKIAETSEALKGRAAEIKARIAEVKQQRDLMAEADKKFKEFKKKFEENVGTPRQLWDEGKQLQSNYKNAEVSWNKELNEIIERIGKMMDTDAAINRRLDFQVRRNEIIKDCNLGDRAKANFSKALESYRKYLEEKPSDDNRNKAENEIRSLNSKAVEDTDTLRRKAERMVEDKKKDEAIDWLKEQRPRFEKTDGEAVLEKVIKDIEKK
jgi:tetratricopeptide (TPR) repeat protein